MKLTILFIFIGSSFAYRNDLSVHSLALGSQSTLYWRVDPTKEMIQFEIHYTGKQSGWFAVGFSNRGELTLADYCVLWIDWHLKVHFEDAWANNKGIIEVDSYQDCNDFAWKRSILRTTHIVWSKGTGPLSNLNGLNIITNAISLGMSRTELLRTVSDKPPEFPSDTWKYQLLTDHVNVPQVETTYWCRVEKLPEALRQKHHVLQFGPVIQPGNEHLVHHMEVFHCAGPSEADIPLYNGPCDAADRPQTTQICKKVLAAWAMGADAFVYPKEAGLSVGGKLFNQYIMLEVHYNNPERIKNKVDSSGIEFYFTKTLRKYDAGVIELGLEYTDKMAIPPHQELFELSGHCVTECTGIGLPQNGIYVFGSQLHTHLTGTTVRTRHIRNGNELSPLNYDNHYSTHFQEIRLLPEPVHILPGDSLITTCTYNTMERNNVTLGGFAISDEMCVNYIHYYPNTRLEVCKSAISDDALRTYFRYMREWENQDTDFDTAVSISYQNIEWTKLRVAALHDLYQAAPLGMQCNGSDGSRLPGLWNNVAATQVKLPLAPPARDCHLINQ
ncbi:GSCOCG00009965001-RA-CDS [Cotesia congregata]|nr:GSCOCG00009965001-RA-CDS [Cotesia congregata]